MTFVVELTPPAIDELVATARWHEQHGSISRAGFVLVVEEAIERIRQFPEACPRVRSAPRFRAFTLRRMRYQVIYEVVGELIRVHAIAHTRRRPGYWLDRRK